MGLDRIVGTLLLRRLNGQLVLFFRPTRFVRPEIRVRFIDLSVSAPNPRRVRARAQTPSMSTITLIAMAKHHVCQLMKERLVRKWRQRTHGDPPARSGVALHVAADRRYQVISQCVPSRKEQNQTRPMAELDMVPEIIVTVVRASAKPTAEALIS